MSATEPPAPVGAGGGARRTAPETPDPALPLQPEPGLLEDGESVLWAEAPDRDGAWRAALAASLRPVALLLAPALVIMVLAVLGDESADAALPSGALLALGTLLAGAALSVPWRRAVHIRRLRYMVTDRRMLVIDGHRARGFGPADLIPLRVTIRRDGTGDVIFALDREPVGHAHCGCGAGICPTPDGRVAAVTEVKEREIESPLGFIAIREPDAVASLISDRFGIPRIQQLN